MEQILSDIRHIIEEAGNRVARSINHERTLSYWQVGKRIVEEEHKITHQDLGQLQMYVNYYDRDIKTDFENPTIGVLLCAYKNDAVVRYSLPLSNQLIFASKYQLY